MEKICQNRLLISLYKVENKKEKIADFKTAISSTVKSLSNSEKLKFRLVMKVLNLDQIQLDYQN